MTGMSLPCSNALVPAGHVLRLRQLESDKDAEIEDLRMEAQDTTRELDAARGTIATTQGRIAELEEEVKVQHSERCLQVMGFRDIHARHGCGGVDLGVIAGTLNASGVIAPYR